MSLLSNLNTDNNNVAGETDRLKGSGVLESGIYEMVIETIYLDQSKGGANNVNIHFKGPNGEKLRVTEYFTNKKGESTYEYQGTAYYLPGYNKFNALSLLGIGKELKDLSTEEKQVNVYDFDQRFFY